MAYEVDRETLSKLKTLDDATMREVIKKFMLASGMSESKANAAANSSGLIRRKLASMNEGDVNRLLSSADEGTVRGIVNTIHSGKAVKNDGK